MMQNVKVKQLYADDIAQPQGMHNIHFQKLSLLIQGMQLFSSDSKQVDA